MKVFTNKEKGFSVELGILIQFSITSYKTGVRTVLYMDDNNKIILEHWKDSITMMEPVASWTYEIDNRELSKEQGK